MAPAAKVAGIATGTATLLEEDELERVSWQHTWLQGKCGALEPQVEFYLRHKFVPSGEF